MGVTVYGEDVRNAILARLETGETLTSILSAPGMPTRETVSQWAREGPWSDAYACARRLGLDQMAEDLLSVARDRTIDPQSLKVDLDARKWYLSKMRPDVYGDRTALQMLDEHGKPAKAGITIIVDGAPGE